MAGRLPTRLRASLSAGLGTVRRRAALQAGYALVEVLAVLVVLAAVLGGLTTLFVQGANAELEMNRRVRAQLQARLALDKLRREVHCATTVAPSGASAAVTLSLPAQCPTGSGLVSWCTVSLGSSRYGLYRKAGALCDSGGVKHADYLTLATVFTYTPPALGSLAKLRVDLPVNVDPARAVGSYRLADDIVLRNSIRA